MKALLKEIADTFLKTENKRLKSQIEELNFLLKIHTTHTQDECSQGSDNT